MHQEVGGLTLGYSQVVQVASGGTDGFPALESPPPPPTLSWALGPSPQMALVCCSVILPGDSALRGATVGHLRPFLDMGQSMETIRAMKTQYHFFQMSWDRAGRDTGAGEILSLCPDWQEKLKESQVLLKPLCIHFGL